MQKYEFNKSCNALRLEQEIKESAITIGVSYINVFVGQKTEIYFKAALSYEEEQILIEIINNHDNTPSQSPQPVVIEQPKDSLGRIIVSSTPFSDSAGFRFRGASFKDMVSFNTTKNIDYLLLEERYINGGILIVDNIGNEDTVTFQVVDKDNILGFGPEVVLDTFIDNFYVPKNIPLLISLSYPARIIKNLYLRCKYTSTHESGALVKCNLFLHKRT